MASFSDTLRGVKSFTVLVEALSADFIDDGLTVEQITTDVELRLRKAGLPVVDASLKDHAFLHIKLTGLKGDDGTYAYGLSVSFMQLVTVNSNGEVTLSATWLADCVGRGSGGNMSKYIREALADKVDEFMNAWLSANPK